MHEASNLLVRALSFMPTRSLSPSARLSPSSVKAALIEVESKFSPPGDTNKLGRQITELGGRPKGSPIEFVDTYWDTQDCSLTRRDIWLRCRETAGRPQWELKLPVEVGGKSHGKRSGGERTVFREVEGAEAVGLALRSVLARELGGAPPSSSLAAALHEAKCFPFAALTTARARWQLGECSLDLDAASGPPGDEASFSHAVMEIEMMVPDEAGVADAEVEIQRVAALVGARPVGSTGGKLETFIRRNCPAVFAQLVEAGVLRAA